MPYKPAKPQTHSKWLKLMEKSLPESIWLNSGPGGNPTNHLIGKERIAGFCNSSADPPTTCSVTWHLVGLFVAVINGTQNLAIFGEQSRCNTIQSVGKVMDYGRNRK